MTVAETDAARRAEIERRTRETSVHAVVAVDGSGTAQIRTGIGFLDHMLEAFAKTAQMDLEVVCVGDLEVEAHHSVEDVGIVLGRALAQALGDRAGIGRYGWALVPMDDALARVALDISGRSYLAWGADLPIHDLGAFRTDLAEEFWRAMAHNAGWTLHVDLLRYRNTHHALESIWKACGLALRTAVLRDSRGRGIPSTKGLLD